MMDATNAINVFDAVDEEEEDRGGWGNKLDFLFSCISVSVGLGSKSDYKYFCFIYCNNFIRDKPVFNDLP